MQTVIQFPSNEDIYAVYADKRARHSVRTIYNLCAVAHKSPNHGEHHIWLARALQRLCEHNFSRLPPSPAKLKPINDLIEDGEWGSAEAAVERATQSGPGVCRDRRILERIVVEDVRDALAFFLHDIKNPNTSQLMRSFPRAAEGDPCTREILQQNNILPDGETLRLQIKQLCVRAGLDQMARENHDRLKYVQRRSGKLVDVSLS